MFYPILLPLWLFDLIPSLNLSAIIFVSFFTPPSDLIIPNVVILLDMVANEEMRELMTEEVAELRENLCCTVYVYNKAESALIGQASLELWAMIEHSCNILRQVRLTAFLVLMLLDLLL